MRKRIMCVAVSLAIVIFASGCWGPFIVSTTFNSEVDRIHDNGGVAVIQIFTFIPVIPALYSISMMIDYIITNPINFFSGGMINKAIEDPTPTPTPEPEPEPEPEPDPEPEPE